MRAHNRDSLLREAALLERRAVELGQEMRSLLAEIYEDDGWNDIGSDPDAWMGPTSDQPEWHGPLEQELIIFFNLLDQILDEAERLLKKAERQLLPGGDRRVGETYLEFHRTRIDPILREHLMWTLSYDRYSRQRHNSRSDREIQPCR